jgi:hypothetical protein
MKSEEKGETEPLRGNLMTAEKEIIQRLDQIIELLESINGKLEEIEGHTNNINSQIADRES